MTSYLRLWSPAQLHRVLTSGGDVENLTVIFQIIIDVQQQPGGCAGVSHGGGGAEARAEAVLHLEHSFLWRHLCWHQD